LTKGAEHFVAAGYDFVAFLQSAFHFNVSGTGDAGLSRWRDGSLVNLTAHEGLPDNNISQILEDDEGRLWLGSSGGIVCLNKHRLDELAAGKIQTIYPHVFGRMDGMMSEECTGGFYPAGLKTKSGLLWFSTLKGVAVVNPHFLGAFESLVAVRPFLPGIVTDLSMVFPRYRRQPLITQAFIREARLMFGAASVRAVL